MTKHSLGRKGIIHGCPCYSPYSGRSEPNLQIWTWKQDLKQRPWRNAAYWLAHPTFLYNSGPFAPGWFYPQGSGPSHINHLSRKCPSDLLAYNANLMVAFSQLRIFLPNDPVTSWQTTTTITTNTGFVFPISILSIFSTYLYFSSVHLGWVIGLS